MLSHFREILSLMQNEWFFFIYFLRCDCTYLSYTKRKYEICLIASFTLGVRNPGVDMS